MGQTKERSIFDTSRLNEDQKKVFDELRTFIAGKSEDIYVIKGWAGTGKTYCVSLLVRYVLEVMKPNNSWYKVSVTGPTNKSVRVIKKSTGIKNPRLVFSTIHKMLGLTERITSDGRQEFVNQGDFRPPIQSVKLLIIDEVSMLSDDLFHEIIKYRDRIKIICMGDPAQIPPVGRPDCIPFRDELAEQYAVKTVSLTQIMRQKEGNPIINTSIIIRENIESDYINTGDRDILIDSGDGVQFLNLNSSQTKEQFNYILDAHFNSDNFKSDPEFCKIIAWRNKTVATMNNLVRRIIYGDKSYENKILIGEKLIANNPIIENDTILFNTNDEFCVEDFTIKQNKFKVENDFVAIKYYETGVSYLNDDDKLIKLYIDILHEDSQQDFDFIVQNLKRTAIEKKGKEKSWIKYYDFLRRYADVSYSYSITAHKSQGSTYNTTFVLEDDININIDVIERNRIKYTAYTRSSNKLFVLKRF
jgi:exodeoxyribonuclease-5